MFSYLLHGLNTAMLFINGEICIILDLHRWPVIFRFVFNHAAVATFAIFQFFLASLYSSINY